MSITYVSLLLKGKRPLNVAYAIKFKYVLGCEAGILVEMLATYELTMNDREVICNITTKEQNIAKELHKIVPFMKQQKILNESSTQSQPVFVLRKRLKVSSLVVIPDLLKAGIYPPPSLKPENPHIKFAWLSVCDIIAVAMQKGEPFNQEKLKASIPWLKEEIEATGRYKELQQLVVF